MIARNDYLQKLIDLRETSVIKIITGIRRCGKSTLFELYKDYLEKNGVDENQIIHINFEDLTYEPLLNYKALNDYITQRLDPKKMNYIFLDEIQAVEQYQKTVDSLLLKKNTDIYITGSNAYLLSGELATLLSGRYIKIEMQPLSFKEYLSVHPGQQNINRLYTTYLTDSSFPGALEFKDRNKIREYLSGIYHTIVMKDVIARLNIGDVFMLESLIKYLFDTIGNLTSTKRIADTMTSAGRKISVHTVERYLSGLVDSYILYRVPRYDVKGKQLLRTGDKYYVADIGLRYFLLGPTQMDRGHILENIVYLELIRRDYRVSVGKIGTAEIDFIATNENGITYYQVALSVRDENVLKRELAPLDEIKDHNPKFLLTLDDDPISDYNGIKQINVLDWLIK